MHIFLDNINILLDLQKIVYYKNVKFYERQFLWFPICIPVHRASLKRLSPLNRKDIALEWGEGGKMFYRVVSLTYYISFAETKCFIDFSPLPTTLVLLKQKSL